MVLVRWHSKALLVSFDNEKESDHYVDILTQEIKQTLGRLDKAIKHIVAHQSGDKVVVQVSCFYKLFLPSGQHAVIQLFPAVAQEFVS